MILRSIAEKAYASVELAIFYGATRRQLLQTLQRGSVGVEIGVWKGDFSAQILALVQPHTLHLVDPWQHHSGAQYFFALYGGWVSSQARLDKIHANVLQRFESERRRGQLRIHRMSSDEACANFEDASLDWVYVDGNHLYEHVKRDIEGYWPKIKPGGYLAGDDYGVSGWWDNGVARAVDEFIATGTCEVVILQHSQWLVRKSLHKD